MVTSVAWHGQGQPGVERWTARLGPRDPADRTQVDGQPIRAAPVEPFDESPLVRLGDRTQCGQEPLAVSGELDLVVAPICEWRSTR